MSQPFNVRIYGLLVHENQLLLIKEPFAGTIITKFPGGGLELGEGTIDCLKREFKEELNLEVEVDSHFYTQDFYLQSRFDPNEQILMIYYNVSCNSIENLEKIDPDIKEIIWQDVSTLSTEDVTLETDKLVVDMWLKEREEANS